MLRSFQRARWGRGRLRRPGLALGACALALGLGGCSVVGTGEENAPSGTVVLVTHDSFAVDKALLTEFEAETGLTVQTRSLGDAGTLVNQLVLSKDAPLGDAVFGIDNSFATRALGAGIVQPYSSPGGEPVRGAGLALDGSDRLNAVDFGDVCVNVDREWFRSRGIPQPRTLEDLTDPTYEDLLVVSNPATSSPGLAFLLATVGAFGADGWPAYWAELRNNGVKVSDSWSDAYFVDFSGSQGRGPRPLVVSYASSPPAEAEPGTRTAPTRALLRTCFRQVEYAGVLTGASNPEGAQQLIDFMLSNPFQETIPDSMYMYPVSREADLPPSWARFGPLAEQPFVVPPEEIDANRADWVRQWTEIVVG